MAVITHKGQIIGNGGGYTKSEVDSMIGNLSSLNTTDKSSAVNAINEVNTKVSKTEVLIAPVLTSLVAPAGGLSTGEQFIYNGLLYKATSAIAQGGTITINGNCTLADSVTGQIKTVRENFGIVKFDISKTSSNQTDFYGYGVYDKSSGTVRIYVASHGNTVSSAIIGFIPSDFRPTYNFAGIGMVNGVVTGYTIQASTGEIRNLQTNNFTDAVCVAEYSI